MRVENKTKLIHFILYNLILNAISENKQVYQTAKYNTKYRSKRAEKGGWWPLANEIRFLNQIEKTAVHLVIGRQAYADVEKLMAVSDKITFPRTVFLWDIRGEEESCGHEPEDLFEVILCAVVAVRAEKVAVGQLD